ncbi:MAG: hypothetical protein KDK91_18535 [Gammaproteobacteria bacterium]|nr:hypothetical protein [Gammaproteobacteria bacterium]
MTLERDYGVPTVAFHTLPFVTVARSVAKVNGMPNLRQVFVPQPVMGKTAAELRAYVDGPDQVTRRPVMQELIEGLTGTANEDVSAHTFERVTPRTVPPGDEDQLQQYFLEQHWTDMLPIVLPTEQRVAAMLAGTSRKPDELVGQMHSTHFREYWGYTVEKVAVNAVMAGARPEYFPVILALAASGVSARGSSSSSMASMVVVNGPVRNELRMNSGIGAMGPYNHANATIGRAYGLLSQNLQGGSVPGHSYMGSQGNAYGYMGVTFAENEERSPWEPLHVQQGFDSKTSAVSVFTGCRATAFTLGLREQYWREHVRNLLRGMDPQGPPVLLLDPLTADQFVRRGGFSQKSSLLDWIHDNARMPAGEFWDYQLIQNYVYPRATFGEQPWANLLNQPTDMLIPMFKREDIHAVVVGGETNAYWRIMSASYQKTLSVDEWR